MVTLIDQICRLELENAIFKIKVQQLEQAGTRLSNRIKDVLDNIIDESALLDALEKWEMAKEEKNNEERDTF